MPAHPSPSRVDKGLNEIETVIRSFSSHTMRDHLFDYVYSKLEEMEERIRNKHTS